MCISLNSCIGKTWIKIVQIEEKKSPKSTTSIPSKKSCTNSKLLYCMYIVKGTVHKWGNAEEIASFYTDLSAITSFTHEYTMYEMGYRSIQRDRLSLIMYKINQKEYIHVLI